MPGGALPPGVRVYRRKRLYTADSDASGAGDGGGIRRASGTVTVKNTLMAGNTDASSGTKHPDCSGTFTTQGYNLIGINTGCSGFTNGVNGDQVGTSGSPLNPQLGPLSNNGGATLTHALLTPSPAIDKGNPATPGSGGNACAATDQRGYARPVDGDNNGSALCDTGGYELGAVPPPAPVTTTTTVTITYAYDKLYRLTSAQYTNGTVFTYTYDAVGNRLTQQTLTQTTVYTYDIANRLTNVGPITYTWDANGNLLGDGASTYAYDAADRLITVTQGANTYIFAYNGLGDRLRQTVNGTPTTYTLDLNAGLTQVLADGTHAYLYGNSRIAQQSTTSTDYFLGDALGSVRQLVSVTGTVTLARSYEPYGSTLSSAGNGTTSYGFTGEWHDANTNLLYLRARYYS
ncbi:MAG TPA: choice-of-anchor Q domain-containing protein, partial [Anaerolineales bacterium]|nr:choice-of-anchor Q domain-containing protein [Anaerolineales bacterium]